MKSHNHDRPLHLPTTLHKTSSRDWISLGKFLKTTFKEHTFTSLVIPVSPTRRVGTDSSWTGSKEPKERESQFLGSNVLLHHSRKLDPVVTTKTRSSPLPPPSTGGNDADTHHLWVCRRTTATLRGRPGTEGARGEGGEPRPEAGATVRGGTGRVGDGPRRRPGTRLEPKQKQALVERGRGSRLGEPDHGCPLEKRENRVPDRKSVV